MSRIKNISLNIAFCIQVLLTFFLFFGDQIRLPLWLQVVGRLHPLLMHLPIGLFILFFILILLPKHDHLEHRTREAITFIVLLLTAFFASLTALCGFLLSVQGDYGASALTNHKVSGAILSWACYLILLAYDRMKERKFVFYGVNSFALITLFVAGHTGATLTHGENFVFQPLVSQQKSFLTLENSSVYRLSVAPVLEKKCYSCHNASKAKGGLVMTSVEEFKKGGKHGREWVAGKPEESNLIKVIHLPLTHDKHMPPDGKAQLTSPETSLLAHWIRSGASFEIKMAELKPDDSLRILAAVMMASQHQTAEKIYGFKPAPEDVVEKLNSPFLSLFPLFQNSAALRADFFVQKAFQLKALDELSAVQDQLVELNLSHMPITDKDLALIGKFKNLEKLNLNFTQVKSDLHELQSLKHLQSLSVSGTAVSATAVDLSLSLPELKTIYAWNTAIAEGDQVALNNKNKNIAIVWNIFRDDKPTRLSPPGIANDLILKKDEALQLRHVMPGVTIRYTLDGSNPDSVNGQVYETPLHLASTTKLKACACKQGWLCSDVYENMCFIEGLKTEKVTLLTPPDPIYPGEGAQSLMDGRKGFADLFKEPSWLGYKENAFAAGFDFGKTAEPVKNIVISYGRNTGSYIFPPTDIEVWAGADAGKVSLIKAIKVPQPSKNEPARIDALFIPMADAKYSYYKIVAKPVHKLPAWHSGKGQKGWFFVDEVFFN